MMRGVAHRRQDDDEASPAPRDFTAEAGALLEGAAALLPVLEARGDARAAMETIILGLRIAELASALEDAAAGEAVVAAAYAQGRADEAAAAGQRAPGPRHAGRKRHLSPVPGIPATAVRTAAVAAVAAVALSGGVVAGMHDESAVRTFAASPARHAALHRMAPDRASVVPSPRWSPSPRPSAAAASARPVPPSAPGPSGAPASSRPAPSVSPPPPPVQAPSPSLLVSVRDLDLSGTSGTFTITAQDGTVGWWVSTDIPGASVSAQAGGQQGVLSRGQEPVTITVTDPQGESGSVYIRWDGGGIATVWVTPSAGAPAVALP